MPAMRFGRFLPALIFLGFVAACGGAFNTNTPTVSDPDAGGGPESLRANPDNSLGAILRRRGRDEQIVRVNKYIWAATLEVLDFLPVQSVDPFTGVIVTGFGTPPGGGRSYRATVLVKDPALDARSLNVALQSRGGPVNASTVRAVEDAILTRARQLRVSDNRL